jgi:hypothetical protein
MADLGCLMASPNAHFRTLKNSRKYTNEVPRVVGMRLAKPQSHTLYIKQTFWHSCTLYTMTKATNVERDRLSWSIMKRFSALHNKKM